MAQHKAEVFQINIKSFLLLDGLTRLAAERGLVLQSEIGRYLLNRCPRDMKHLQILLDELDRASLVAQRRLTIPFVKEVLQDVWGEPGPAPDTIEPGDRG